MVVLIFLLMIDGIVHHMDFSLHLIDLCIALRFLYGVCIYIEWYITYSGIEISHIPHPFPHLSSVTPSSRWFRFFFFRALPLSEMRRYVALPLLPEIYPVLFFGRFSCFRFFFLFFRLLFFARSSELDESTRSIATTTCDIFPSFF
jgi:hypothetical protein